MAFWSTLSFKNGDISLDSKAKIYLSMEKMWAKSSPNPISLIYCISSMVSKRTNFCLLLRIRKLIEGGKKSKELGENYFSMVFGLINDSKDETIQRRILFEETQCICSNLKIFK